MFKYNATERHLGSVMITQYSGYRTFSRFRDFHFEFEKHLGWAIAITVNNLVPEKTTFSIRSIF